jgi:hypothetical protein
MQTTLFQGETAMSQKQSLMPSTPDSPQSVHSGFTVLLDVFINCRILKDDLDYHLIRASMVIIFLFFGYQKWFEYEAQGLIPYISNGPLISWMYPVFGIRGASWFLGVSEWLFAALLFLGFWKKELGILGARRCMFLIYSDSHDYPIYAERLGRLCRWVSRNDWQRAFPYEGYGSSCCVILFTEAGCSESVRSRSERMT